MTEQPLTLHSFLRAIIHIDADAFFASCEQSRNPKLQGQPVVTGKERGIAASLSYEAKACGVKRGMLLAEIKMVCPEAIILPSDYETYSLLSKRLFAIVRRFTPEVEEYGIDECFADLTGLRRHFRMPYHKIARTIKETLDKELGFTFSVGLAPNKVIAKIASKWQKPSGFTVISGPKIHLYLADLAVEKIWGIGPQTAAYLNKQGIKTALALAQRNEAWVKHHLTKPFLEIWRELNGNFILPLQTEEKTNYQSIQKVRTFTPASNKRDFVFAQLTKNIENACLKARRYNLAAKKIALYLKTQNFSYNALEVTFSAPSHFPNEIIQIIEPAFNKIFQPKLHYRATGVTLLMLEEYNAIQLDLFRPALKVEKMKNLFQSIDSVNQKFGKHTLFLGASFLAHQFSQHLGERGDIPQRKVDLLKGETKRQHLAIPRFMGEVS